MFITTGCQACVLEPVSQMATLLSILLASLLVQQPGLFPAAHLPASGLRSMLEGQRMETRHLWQSSVPREARQVWPHWG